MDLTLWTSYREHVTCRACSHGVRRSSCLLLLSTLLVTARRSLPAADHLGPGRPTRATDGPRVPLPPSDATLPAPTLAGQTDRQPSPAASVCARAAFEPERPSEMQPRPIAMPVRQSAAPSTRDKSPPPAASSQPAARTVKAEAEATSSEPTTATGKPKRKRKKKAEPAADRRPKLKPKEEEEVTASDTPVIAMVTDAGAAAPRPYRGKCLYQSRKCENERALKRNGLPHNLCEEHRSKQNQHQRKFDAKKFSRKRRSDTDGELEADDGDEPAPLDKKRARVSTAQQQQKQEHQQQQLQQAAVAHTSVAAPPQSVSFTPGTAPPLMSFAASPAHALYAGSAAPVGTTFHVGTSSALGHALANHSLIPGVNHQEYHGILHPRTSPQHLDHRTLLPQQSPSPHHLHPQQQVAYTAGYSRSELEAARILVPASMATSSNAPAAYTDPRQAYLQPRSYQQQPQQENHQQPVIRRATSVPPIAGADRPQDSMLFRPQAISPPTRVLPSLRHPPTPTFAHVEAQRLHHLGPSINTSLAPSLTLRSPLHSTSAPLPSVPRLASLAPPPLPLPPTTSDALPSLAPIRFRRSPLRPATSQ